MTAEKLTKLWKERYRIEPRAHDLRNACADRWLRIHALPKSKRYPETPEKYTIVLTRHTEVLSTLFPKGIHAILVTIGAYRNQTAASWCWTTISIDPGDHQGDKWQLYGAPIIWQDGLLDEELSRVTDWKSVNVIILGDELNAAYHPYDGGGDIIARDEQQRDRLKERFREWLSPLPSGL